jgi:transposase
MTAERVPMRKLREVIRLKLEMKLSGRAISRSCGLSPSTVSHYLGRIAVAKVEWPLPPELDDEALNRLLFPQEGHPAAIRPEPDWCVIHQELKRKHVTKSLLWQEYRESQSDGYEYSRFCERYQRWVGRLGVTMRQAHIAGEKCFVDFSGDGLEVTDPATGEVRVAKLFVAVLGASNLTYVEPVFTEELPVWIACHVHAFEFFGGVSEILVPDNLRSAVTKASKYEPEVNRTYADLARHYGTAIIPARAYKPRDKAKVEQGVLLASRWILAVLRNHSFFSLAELRAAVKLLVTRLNDRQMKKLKKSRRQLFDEVERGTLKPLPSEPYEFADWEQPRVGLDYHVEFDDHHYSVLYTRYREQLDLRATATTIEVFRGGHREASHARSYVKHGYTTLGEHMPKGHREYAEWTPERLITWAKTIGPMTAAVVEEIMLSRAHPQQGFRACLGIMRLRSAYEDTRIERACTRAKERRACSYRSVAAILQNNLDKDETSVEEQQGCLPTHENVRGPGYYDYH